MIEKIDLFAHWKRYVLAIGLGLLLAACGGAGDSVDELARANKLIENGDRAGAIVVLKVMLQAVPEFVPGRERLAELYVYLGDGDSAHTEVLKAIDNGMDPSAAEPLLIRALLMKGEVDEALKRLAEVRQRSDEAVFDLLYGHAKMARREVDVAQLAYEETLERDPGNAEALLGLARVMALLENYDTARSRLSESLRADPQLVDAHLFDGNMKLTLGDPEEALMAFTEAARLNPFSGAALGGQTRVLLKQERFDDARTLLSQAKRRFVGNLLVVYWEGIIEYYAGNLEGAEARFREILSKAPGDRASNFYMGSLMFRAGNLAQAEQHLQQYLRQAPHYGPVNKLLAGVQIKQGRPQAALDTLDDGLGKQPDDGETLALRASALLSLGQTDEALKLLDQAAAAIPHEKAMNTHVMLIRLQSSQADAAMAQLVEQARSGEGVAESRALLIYALIRKQQWDRAIEEANSAISRYGERVAFVNGLGAAYLAKGDVENARAHFSRAMEIAPNSVEVVRNLAILELGQLELEAAAAAVAKLERLAPGDHKTMTLVGRLALANKNYTKAYRQFEAARSAYPRALEARMRLGYLDIQSGRFKRAIEMAKEAVAISPNQLGPRLLLVEAQRYAGEAAAALEGIDEAAAIFAGSVQVHYLAAMIKLDQGLLDAADVHLARAFEIGSPQNPQLLSGRARAAILRGDRDAAIDAIDRLQAVDGKSGRVHELRGDLAMHTGALDEAIAHYELATAELAPRLTVLKLHQARIKAGAIDDAIADLERRIATDPGAGAYQALLAQTYEQAGRPVDAARLYDAVLKYQPRSVMALNNLALLHFESGKDDALQLAEKAYSLAPLSAAVQDTFGWMLVRRGQVERGATIMAGAVKALPDDGDLRYRYAIALTKVGDRAAAVEQLRIVLESGPFEARAKAVRLYTTLGGTEAR